MTEPATDPRAVVLVIGPDLQNAIAGLPDPDDLDGPGLVRFDEQRAEIAEDVFHLAVAALGRDHHDPDAEGDPMLNLEAFADYMARLDASDNTYIEWDDVEGYLPSIVADMQRLTRELAAEREYLSSLFRHEVGEALIEQGGHFTCTEADALVELARHAGCDQFADQFLAAHQSTDGAGDGHTL